MGIFILFPVNGFAQIWPIGSRCVVCFYKVYCSLYDYKLVFLSDRAEPLTTDCNGRRGKGGFLKYLKIYVFNNGVREQCTHFKSSQCLNPVLVEGYRNRPNRACRSPLWVLEGYRNRPSPLLVSLLQT